MNLTPYEEHVFKNVSKCNLNQWYLISSHKGKESQVTVALKKRIDHFNDFEFNADSTMYRRILTVDEMLSEHKDMAAVYLPMVIKHHEEVLAQTLANEDVQAAIEKNRNSYRKY
jgi:hypothetical protein